MRNQPLNILGTRENHSSEGPMPEVDRLRLRGLSVVFALAMTVVLCRIGWVQAKLQDRYLAVLNQTTTEYEAIPARDGRILDDASVVYAADVDQYSLQIHYRWLEKPINDAWLKRQVRNRLSESERDVPEAVQECRNSILAARGTMWSRLTALSPQTADQLTRKRAQIQERVEQVADSVNRRYFQVPEDEAAGDADGWLMRIAGAVRSAVTTTPHRRRQERMIVREEESYHEIFPDVPFDMAATVREQPHLYPGVRVVAGNRRTYPQGMVASHIVGARTKASEEELNTLVLRNPLATWIPDVGRFGVERSFDHQLQSVPGLRKITRNRRQEVLESTIEREPVSGRDVVLTLNPRLQTLAEQLLAEALLDRPSEFLATESDETESPKPIPTGGSIVVMNVVTGRLLVAASAPSFSLKLFTGGTAEEWKRINADRRHPFISRISSMALPPGSVMKPITAVAAVESGGLNPQAPFFCQGYLTSPDEHRCLVYRLYGNGHQEITLRSALARSCNVYFFAAARETGFQNLRLWCDHFGLGKPTGIDLPFERNGNLPGARAADDRTMERETLGLAIGQSRLTVTPLQMTRAIAAVANGGWLVTPHVVSPDGTARTTQDIDDRPRNLARRRIPGLSNNTLQMIRNGMNAAVQESYGTGHRTARLDEVDIAGKSGTAETSPGQPDHAWFAGYVPADKPQYAFVVVLENGGSGSRAAGPLARELIRRLHGDGLLSEHD